MEKEAIPAQKKGTSFDVQEVITVEDRDIAVSKYQIAKQRLLNVSLWGIIAKEDPSAFLLTDPDGNKQDRLAVEGDLIKIHLPGPRSRIGDGADWVVIEKIIEERNRYLDEVFTAMTVRPCRNPCAGEKEIAHFYDDITTNTLLICRHRIELVASIHGRNEQVNTDTDWLALIRNLLVALPAKAGISNAHWKKLAKGFIS